MEKQLLDGLAHIRKRPLMYFSNQVPAVVNFIEGFKTACLLLEPASNYHAIYQQVIQERGWKLSAQAIWDQMQERGMDDQAVIAELLEIQHQVWTKLLPEADEAVDNEEV